MTTGLIVSLRFPAGQFNATGEDGQAEWPPSPARVQAALLGSAHLARDSEGVAAVETLYRLADCRPLIFTPAFGQRSNDYRAWVQTQDESTPLGAKTRKAPQPGVLVNPDSEVVLFWSDAHGVDIAALDRVATTVPWLGRPTSPVMMSVSVGQRPERTSDVTLWEPADHGVMIGIGDEPHLSALEARFDQTNSASRNYGATIHPRMRRSFAAYSQSAAHGGGGDQVTPPSTTRLNEIMNSVAIIGLTGATAEQRDSRAVIATVQAPSADAALLPVFGSINEAPRIFGVIVINGSGVESGAPVLTANGVAHTVLRADASPAFRSTLRRAISTATSWTTSAPVVNDPAGLRAGVLDAAGRAGVGVADAVTHDACIAPGEQHVADRSDFTHVTIQFTAPVSGPVQLCGVVLLPTPGAADAAHRTSTQ